MNRKFIIFIFTIFITFSCQGQKSESPRKFEIPDGKIEPSVWGNNYPVEYNL